MSQVVYRGNLSAASFPFISKNEGRSVIVPSADNNFNRTINSSVDLDKDAGIPQIYYCHNVMPSSAGTQSIGYEQRVGPIAGTPGCVQQFIVRDDSVGRKGYLTLATGGFYFIENENLGYSEYLTQRNSAGILVPLPPAIQTLQISTAHVNGITYIFISGYICIRYDFAAQQLVEVTLTGLTGSAILGITETNGYMIAVSANAAAWSSLIDPTDFSPSLTTGAGGGNVDGIKGNITCVAPTSGGFTVFTDQNAVSVLYTGNTRYPFQFSECIGAGGVTTLERVTYEADSGYNYFYGSNGFQLIQSKSAQTILTEVTDFFAGQLFEDFNEVTSAFEYTVLSVPLLKKMNLVASRYLVISYGISSLTHALVYDTVTKRFGKLKIPHVDCFQYELLSEVYSDIPRKSIGFLQANGTILVVDFAAAHTTRSGVALFGKYQYVRTRKMQLQTADFENVTPNAFSITCWTSFEGNGIDMQTSGTLLFQGPDLSRYGFDSPAGTNHTLLAQGCFDLNSLVLGFNVHGRM